MDTRDFSSSEYLPPVDSDHSSSTASKQHAVSTTASKQWAKNTTSLAYIARQPSSLCPSPRRAVRRSKHRGPLKQSSLQSRDLPIVYIPNRRPIRASRRTCIVLFGVSIARLTWDPSLKKWFTPRLNTEDHRFIVLTYTVQYTVDPTYVTVTSARSISTTYQSIKRKATAITQAALNFITPSLSSVTQVHSRIKESIAKLPTLT